MEEGDRITLRLERENLARIDEFLASHKEFGSRSQLCRAALQSFLDRARGSSDEISVRVPRVLLDYIDVLVNEGYFLSREHALLRSIEAFFSRDRVTEIAAHKREIDKAAGRVIQVAGGDEVIPR